MGLKFFRMHIVLLGKNGQLGWELQNTLQAMGAVHACGRDDVDLEDFESVHRLFGEVRPEAIINAAAFTAVDAAEGQVEKAYALNAEVPGILAKEARSLGALLIHFSTDYVFDGAKGSPYTEGDHPNPLSVYGKSKLAGDQAIQEVGGNFLILRTGWLYGARRESFVSKVLEWSRTQETMRVVSDQIGSPSWSRSLAEVTCQVMEMGVEQVGKLSGLYHLAGDGYTSRLEWARKILELDPNRHTQIVKALLT